MAREGEGDREGEREKTRARGMSPVCASIDIIPLRRDKIELKSKTGYYLSAKTFCLGWETAAATPDFLPERAHSVSPNEDNEDNERKRLFPIGSGIEKSVGLSSDLRGSLKRHWTPIKINRRRKNLLRST